MQTVLSVRAIFGGGKPTGSVVSLLQANCLLSSILTNRNLIIIIASTYPHIEIIQLPGPKHPCRGIVDGI